MHPYPNPPESVSPGDLPEPDYTPEGVPIPAFTPWQAKRERTGGWSPETQRAFIHELTRIGSIGAAARAVGKTARSAYQLRDKVGAESFAAAWEAAKLSGHNHAQQIAIERALHGEVMPQFRAGRFAGYKIVYNDNLLVATLGSWKSNSDFGGPTLAEWHRRLEKWEAALRREAMDLADGTAATQQARDDAWQDHVVWRREMKAEERRQRNAEIRAAVRKGMQKPAPPVPRISML
jgi:hypothetical protein